MSIHKGKKLLATAGLALGLMFAGGAAQSSVLYSFEDDDIDFVLRGGVVVTSGPILQGDVLGSAIQIPDFTKNFGGGAVNAIPAGQELTGISAVQILSCGNAAPGTACSGAAGTNYIFGPTAAGLNSFIALAGS